MASVHSPAFPIREPGEASAPAGHVPGEAGLWFFILTDMLLEFGTIFGCFQWDRAADPETFAPGRATLSQGLGLTNTLLLLTSSMFVALAVQSLRRGQRNEAARMFVWARTLGLGFVAIKVAEYGMKFDAGLSRPRTPI